MTQGSNPEGPSRRFQFADHKASDHPGVIAWWRIEHWELPFLRRGRSLDEHLPNSNMTV